MADEDIYSKEGRKNLVEDDEITPIEEGFMEGARDDGQGAKCRKCGKPLLDNFIEKEINGEIYRFCSNRCADKFVQTKKS